jgi:hypothetical protein
LVADLVLLFIASYLPFCRYGFLCLNSCFTAQHLVPRRNFPTPSRWIPVPVLLRSAVASTCCLGCVHVFPSSVAPVFIPVPRVCVPHLLPDFPRYPCFGLLLQKALHNAWSGASNSSPLFSVFIGGGIWTICFIFQDFFC